MKRTDVMGFHALRKLRATPAPWDVKQGRPRTEEQALVLVHLGGGGDVRAHHAYRAPCARVVAQRVPERLRLLCRLVVVPGINDPLATVLPSVAADQKERLDALQQGAQGSLFCKGGSSVCSRDGAYLPGLRAGRR